MLTEIISIAGDYALSAAVQFIAGIMLSMLVYKLLAASQLLHKANYIVVGFVSSILGIILPLGPFGILPLIIGALCAGASASAVIPLAASNLIFSLLIPFTEISYNGDLAFLRVICAFLAGVLSLFVFRVIFKNGSGWLRKNITDKFKGYYENNKMLSVFSAMINEFGLFLIFGVILNAVRNYYFSDALGAVLNSSGGLVLRNFLLDHNFSSNPLFITSATIFNTATNLTIPAALLAFLRLRSVILIYAVTGFICAVLVSLILI